MKTSLNLTALALAASMLLPGAAGAQQPAAAAPAAAIAPPAYVPPDTPQGTGMYPATMQVAPGLPTHTLYRPADLAGLGDGKLPIVVFGNGACVNVGNRFRYFLSEIASHGFFVLATGPVGPASAESSTDTASLRGTPYAKSPAALRVPGTDPTLPVADTTAAQLTDAIDWAIAENSRAGSPYQGRIDTAKIAVMGQSCGGLQALAAAQDPRVSTVGVWNSGLFPSAERMVEIAAAHTSKEALATLHGSALYVHGDRSDQAFKNAVDDVARINGIPLVHAWRDHTPHAGTYREPNGGAFGPVAVAWLQWQLKGDQQAARMFTGADCGLCRKPEWHIEKKNIDQPGLAELHRAGWREQ